MARKSRKNIEQVEIKERIPEIQNERKVKVGGYVRLSSDQYDNDSIDTQILMIRQFLKDYPDMELEEIYCDEGYSGTNFVRPDFARLMQDIRSGRIECIIVKDFSRFGRNYIEAGYYLETVLPHLGVRFISINDRFDSAREEDRDGMAVPIKNMVNAMYAIDVSKKIVKGVELHNQLGDAKYRTSTYGYLLDRKNNTLVVDPDASRYVRLIFAWFLMGYSARTIAERLDFMGVPIPNVYKEQFSKRRSTSKTGKWTHAAICFILRNPTYVGDKVHGKLRTRLVEHIDHERTMPEDWVVHHDSHEPIIDRRSFALAQERLDGYRDKFRQNRIEVAPLGEAFKNSFSGRVICKDCGAVMWYHRKSNGKSRYGFQSAYYTCSEKKNAPCRNVVYEDYLKAIVLDQIKCLIQFVVGQKELISSLREGRSEKSVLLSNEKKLIHLKKKEADFDDLILNLYKDLADGVIDENDYKVLNGRYLTEKSQVQEEIKKVNETVFRMRKWIDTFENLGKKLNEYIAASVDSQVLIDELIERVFVSKDDSIEIVFKCDDVIKRFLSLAGDESEEYCNLSETVAG
jgi:DNA invertase Pin-like site-specific DNA recombinase